MSSDSIEPKVDFKIDEPSKPVYLENICLKRYVEAKKKYCLQFRRDIKEMASLQTNALAGVRLQRMFCIGLKIPKLKNELKPHQKKRLVELVEE